MDYEPLLFSFFFFLAFAVYLFLGVYVIHINPKSRLNRQFLAVCVALCFWSFGFSLANSAATAESCLFWRRISAVGWTTAYAFLLHFFIVLPKPSFTSKYRFWWVPLYIPAAINLYVFSLSKRLSVQQYNLVLKKFGWTNAAVNNGWDIFFFVYYGSYILASLALLWYRRRTTKDDIRKQSTLLFFSLIVAGILGSLTDIVARAIMTNPLPQLAPLVNLIPIMAIYFSIKRYNLLTDAVEEETELILDHKTRSRLYYHLALGFLFGALLSFVPSFFPYIRGYDGISRFAFETSGLLFLFGLAVLIFKSLKAGNVKDTLILVTILLSIPIISLRYIDQSDITVWAFPMILMIVALVFKSRLPLILITLVASATQALVWIYGGPTPVETNHFDFILRIGLFLMAGVIGSVVNRIYVRRLRENADQIAIQKMVSEISFDFMNTNEANIGGKIDALLVRIGDFFEVDRVRLVLINDEKGTMSLTSEWCAPGIKSKKATVQDLPVGLFPWSVGKVKGSEVIYIPDVEKLPLEASLEKAQFLSDNVRSVISVPIEENERVLGFLGLDSIEKVKQWSSYQLELISIIANLLGHALVKIKAEQEIAFMAYYDHLTGLPNRILFADRLEQAINLCKRSEKLIGVVFMDLDSFKTINDTLGHGGGDAILKTVGTTLAHHLRKTDTIARFTGDEFLILINDIDNPEDIVSVADKIMNVFKNPFVHNEQEFFLTASAGISVFPVDGGDAHSLIENADIAMSRAKANGKDQYVLCTPDMKAEVKRNMALSNNMFRVHERGELQVFYQPQINLESGQIKGVEALLRWFHPRMGMISPSVFIPLAEKNGLITGIGDWVLRTAAKQNKAWQEAGFPHLRLAVNLSVIQFNDPRIVNRVAEVLEETGLSPEYLELEITENIAIKEPNYTMGILSRLKALGVSVAIDDFGTEYSSLSRLKILPVDRIKVDMFFVQGIDGSEKDRAITEVIINLGKSLGLEVLAEGVETAVQLEFLKQKNCDDVQGYFFFRPMPAADLEKILRSGVNVSV